MYNSVRTVTPGGPIILDSHCSPWPVLAWRPAMIKLISAMVKTCAPSLNCPAPWLK